MTTSIWTQSVKLIHILLMSGNFQAAHFFRYTITSKVIFSEASLHNFVLVLISIKMPTALLYQQKSCFFKKRLIVLAGKKRLHLDNQSVP